MLRLCSSLLPHTLVLFILFLSGCTNSVNDTTAPQTESAGSAKVRFIHSASSTTGLDFAYRDLSDNNYYILQDNTVYGHQYGYYDLLAGNRQIRAYLSDSQIAVTTLTVLFEKDRKYSLIAYDLEATINPELLAFNDTTASPDSGKSFVRFIHMSTDVNQLNVSDSEDDKSLVVLNKLERSVYYTLPSKTYHFRVANPQSQEMLLEDIPVTLLSKQICTLVFSGSVSGLTPVLFNAVLYRETGI